MNIIDKIYDNLSVKEKFEVCKEIIASNLSIEETDKEIDKIKSTLDDYERQVFYNHFHKHIWEKYKQLNKAFLKEIVYKNYYIIQTAKQNRKVILVYLISNNVVVEKDFEIVEKFIESENQSTNYQEQIILEKNILNLFDKKYTKEMFELTNNLFKIEEDSRNEIKLIITALNNWKEEYKNLNSTEFIDESLKIIDDFNLN